MACFVVSAAEAVAVTAATKVMEKKAGAAGTPHQAEQRIGFVRKLKWLSNMLWGGSLLLVFEHLWHGELVPWFPFLTAVNTGDTQAMLAEIGSTGVLMAGLITAVWAVMVLVTGVMEKNALKSGSPAVQ